MLRIIILPSVPAGKIDGRGNQVLVRKCLTSRILNKRAPRTKVAKFYNRLRNTSGSQIP